MHLQFKNFQSTSQCFLNIEYEKYISHLYETAQREREENPDLPRVTKKSLRSEIERPKLRITPLTDEQSLEQFIENFRKNSKCFCKTAPYK